MLTSPVSHPPPPPPPPSSSQLSTYNNGRSNHNDRRSVSLTPRHHDIPIEKQSSNQLTMFHYGDHTDEPRHHQSRTNQQHRDSDPSVNRHHHRSKHRTYEKKTKSIFQFSLLFRKSPIRTTISSNNNRVLSVSGKLRCSRCNDELGSIDIRIDSLILNQ